MILGFFQNACILIAFMSVVHHFLKDKNIFDGLSVVGKTVLGICAGILGMILMLNSVHITSDVMFDFRYIPILLAAFYGGFLPSIIASVIIGLFRFLFLGISNSSIIGLIAALLIGLGFGVIVTLKISKKNQWIYSMLYLIIVAAISSRIVLKDNRLLFHTMAVFILGYLILSCFIIKYSDYILEMVQIYQKLKQEATKDYLTGLNNVRQFDDNFNNIAQMTLRKEEELSLLLIDIDFFKKVNDTYGHNAGDIVLKSLAPIFLNTCRPYDIISRNGGEEFSILLLDCSASKAVQIAERVRKNIEKNNFHITDKQTINITISIGISSYPEATSQIDNLLENADTALYQAKKTGRNKVVLYNTDKT